MDAESRLEGLYKGEDMLEVWALTKLPHVGILYTNDARPPTTRRFRHRHLTPLSSSTLLYSLTLIPHTTMADDSVPLPYPNLKVPQWQYQIVSIPTLKDQASTSFWKAVEEDGRLNQPTMLFRALTIRNGPVS